MAWLLQDSGENSVYVAAHGKPYILREVTAPPAVDSVNLTLWNAVQIPVPRPSARSSTPASYHDDPDQPGGGR